MSKILAESLGEFKGNKSEEVNEAKGLFGDIEAQGKQFRKMFLPAGHAIIKKGQKEHLASMHKWLNKLAELGWPKDSVLKSKVGEKNFKGLQQVNKFLNNNLSSFAATPGGATQAKTADTGKDDSQRAAAIAQVLGIEVSELVDLLKKG